jgi:hypothetical protein
MLALGVIVENLPAPERVEVDTIGHSKERVKDVPLQRETRVKYLSLICLAMVKEVCSTLVVFLVEVSRKGIESWSANCCTKAFDICMKKMAYLGHGVLDYLLAGQI